LHAVNLSRRSILYSINGTIGNIAYYNGERVILGKSVAYITCNTTIAFPFIFHYLQTSFVKKFYALEMTGSTISNLSLGSIRRTPIKAPRSRDEQENIVTKLDQLMSTLTIEQYNLNKLQSIKHGLMNDLLTGRVRVEANRNSKAIAGSQRNAKRGIKT